MLPGQRRVSAVTILVGLVAVLVPALAWMQYQWLGQLSEAERERMQRTLRTAAAQFATEFDGELSRTLVSLQVDGVTIRDENWSAYAQRYSAWASSAGESRLVRDVWLVDTLPGTPLPSLDNAKLTVPVGRLRIRRWSTDARTFEDAQWPADLLRVRDSLASRFIGFQVQRGRAGGTGEMHREASVMLSLGDDHTLISPVTLFEFNDDQAGPPRITIMGFTIVRLDPAIIRDTMLATLTARHFHGDGDEVNYRVAVVERDRPDNVVWESEPGAAARVAAAPDVLHTFMGPRPDQMFVFARGLTGDMPPPPPPPPPPAPADADADGEAPATIIRSDNIVVSMVERDNRVTGRMITRAGQLGGQGRWTLMATHRAGSLEAAVAAVRTRNLMVSSGVLILLSLAVGLIVVSARRAQGLARQQMEFVAAVSHELRTPVSVIGTAAGNLADGVVGEPERVKKYGETIQGEARRLAETVERVLQLAGIAAGRAAAAQVPVHPADLVHDSIAACRHEIETAGVAVEVAIADGLPNVAGDIVALRSALQNLISNAVKYGGEARWLRVSAHLAAPGSRPSAHAMAGHRPAGRASSSVLFTVEDRGLGIAADDRLRIFEPFYRGREAVSRQIQGSGLGLNLVHRIAEAHGGAVSVTSEPGQGSTFTLALPAVHDRPAAEFVGARLEARPNI